MGGSDSSSGEEESNEEDSSDEDENMQDADGFGDNAHLPLKKVEDMTKMDITRELRALKAQGRYLGVVSGARPFLTRAIACARAGIPQPPKLEVLKANITIKRRQDIEFLTKVQMQEELKERKEMHQYMGKVSGSREWLIDALWNCVKTQMDREKAERDRIKTEAMQMAAKAAAFRRKERRKEQEELAKEHKALRPKVPQDVNTMTKALIIAELSLWKEEGLYTGRLSGNREPLALSLKNVLQRNKGKNGNRNGKNSKNKKNSNNGNNGNGGNGGNNDNNDGLNGGSNGNKRQRESYNHSPSKRSREDMALESIKASPIKMKSIKVLIRDNKDPEFCIVCTGTLNQSTSTYHVIKADGAMVAMSARDVFPMEPPLHACSSSIGKGDIGRQIAVFYPPEDTWYCGKIEQWRASKEGGAQSTLGIHSVRFEVNDEMEDIVLDKEKFVWMSYPGGRQQRRLSSMSPRRNGRNGGSGGGRGGCSGGNSSSSSSSNRANSGANQRVATHSPSAGNVEITTSSVQSKSNTGLSSAYHLCHTQVASERRNALGSRSSSPPPSSSHSSSMFASPPHSFMGRMLANPVNVLVYQHDAAHSFVEGRIVSLDYKQKTANVFAFCSNKVMKQCRFQDIVELAQFGHGINWEYPTSDDENKFVAVFWPDDGRWYAASITSVNDGESRHARTVGNHLSHHVKYLDGTEGQWLHLGHERYVVVSSGMVLDPEVPPSPFYGSAEGNSNESLRNDSLANVVAGPPQVVLFRALNSDTIHLPERGVLYEGRVVASERLSLIVDIGDGFKRRVSRTICTVLADFNSTAFSVTCWNDVGRRLATRRRPNMNGKNESTNGGTGSSSSSSSSSSNAGGLSEISVQWEECVVISYRNQTGGMHSGEHQVQYLRDGRIEFININEMRYVWIDGLAASPLDNSDMPVVLRVGDKIKARWRGGSREFPEHYVATITKMTVSGADLKYHQKKLGQFENVPWNDIAQARCTLSLETASKLNPGTMVSAKWRHGSNWLGWYAGEVLGVYIRKHTREIFVKISYRNEHGTGNHKEQIPICDIQISCFL